MRFSSRLNRRFGSIFYRQISSAIESLLSRVSYAVNQEFVGADVVLHDGDELALIPPVSGGSDG